MKRKSMKTKRVFHGLCITPLQYGFHCVKASFFAVDNFQFFRETMSGSRLLTNPSVFVKKSFSYPQFSTQQAICCIICYPQ
jgi:hypothetical protein